MQTRRTWFSNCLDDLENKEPCKNLKPKLRNIIYFLEHVDCLSICFVEVATTLGTSAEVTSTDYAVVTSIPVVTYTPGRSD